ncbi:MAG: hydroxyacid dehydrogenase [Candidatus Aminicenantia bacterium]
MEMTKILVADPLNKNAMEELQGIKGFEVVVKTGMKEDELIQAIPSFEAIIVRSATKVTKKVIDSAENLKIIVRAGIGLDNIDVKAAEEKGIKVANTPTATSISVAELTLGLMLSLARRIPYANQSMKERRWEKKTLEGTELYGKTLGIIGFGRIGKEVSKRAKAFGMEIIVYDVIKITDLDVKQVELDELLRSSDYITIHVPLTDQTRGMISKREFEKMKDGVFILNMARGGIVDEKALLEALNSGKVKGAGLDVFEKEPPEDFTLIEHPNVVCTPHVGAAAEEGQERAGFEVVRVLKEFFKVS